ncbi:transcriptional regulator [Azomonas macrocytogenes]|uniref:Transcriptional regulator with XRE-family HTH domain n=1 Tax=Azomonas macrocytogenes TaxID=69962 RepID=A0A839T0V3_AZOMA|nr:transcriptional regulator [Azomonas macrocytogenes]MBB3102180.1 transcriptional regulator with XRE-family HTH domain [Azomonas macrocytogenes]
MNEKTEFAERLRNAMLTAGYPDRPAVLEREFNSRYWGRSVTFQAASRWLRGQSIPSQDKLQVLAKWLDVEPQTLRFGEPSIRSCTSAIQVQETSANYYLERETFEAFLSLSTPQRKIVREVILAFAKASQADKTE